MTFLDRNKNIRLENLKNRSLKLSTVVAPTKLNNSGGLKFDLLKRKLNIKIFVIGVICVFLLSFSSIWLINLLEREPSEAFASASFNNIFDESFGNGGQIPLIDTITHKLTSVIFTEAFDGSYLGASQAISKTDSKENTLGIFSLLPGGTLNRTFGNQGVFLLPAIPSINPVDIVATETSIYVLSEIDDCLNTESVLCTGKDIIISKHLSNGLIDENFGSKGLLKLNLTDNLEQTNIEQRNDSPFALVATSDGGAAFLATNFYQSQEQNFQRLIVGKFNAAGLMQQDFGNKGLIFLESEGLGLKPQDLIPVKISPQQRNQYQVQFHDIHGNFYEVYLTANGNLRLHPDTNGLLFSQEIPSEIFSTEANLIKSQRLSNGKIIFYGFCNQTSPDRWSSFCLARFHNGEIDTTFNSEQQGRFYINYYNEAVLDKIEGLQFLEEKLTQQMIFGIEAKSEDGLTNFTEIVTIRPDGTTNKNFSETGIFRAATGIKIKYIQTQGKILAADQSNIYILKQPLYIDPVIRDITPNRGTVAGGVKVTITGENFIQNPQNPVLNSFTVGGSSTPAGILEGFKSILLKDDSVIVSGNFFDSVRFGETTLIGEKDFTSGFIAKSNSQGEILWSNVLGGKGGDDRVLKILTSETENEIYVLTESSSDLSYSSKDLPPSLTNKLVLSKYSQNGELIWIIPISSNKNLEFVDLIIENNNLYLIGNFNENLNLLTIQNFSQFKNGFLAAIDQSGQLKNFTTLGFNDFLEIKKILIKPDKRLAILGETTGNLISPTKTVFNNGSKDIFQVEFGENLEILNVDIFGGFGLDEFTDAAVDHKGNIIISAELTRTPGGVNLESLTPTTFKLSPLGELIWVFRGGGNLKPLPFGQTLIYGVYQDNLLFGDTLLTSKGNSDVYLGVVNEQGLKEWVKSFGSPGEETLNQVLVNQFNDIYISGGFSQTAGFDNLALSSLGGLDIFVLKISSGGKIYWIKQAGGQKDDKSMTLLQNNDPQKLLLSSLISGTASFDKQKLEPNNTFVVVSTYISDKDLMVLFNNRPATEIEILNSQTLIATTPQAETEGFVQVEIIGYDGSSFILAGGFEYVTVFDIMDLGDEPANVRSSGSGGSGRVFI